MGFLSVSGSGESLPQSAPPVKPKEAIQVPTGVDFSKEAQAVGLKLYDKRPTGASVQLTQGGKTYWTTEKDLTECACRITLMKKEETGLESDLNKIAASLLNDKIQSFNKKQLSISKSQKDPLKKAEEMSAVQKEALAYFKDRKAGLEQRIVKDLKSLNEDFHLVQDTSMKTDMDVGLKEKVEAAKSRLVEYGKFGLEALRSIADHSKPIDDGTNILKQSDNEKFEAIQGRVKEILSQKKEINVQPGTLAALLNKVIG